MKVPELENVSIRLLLTECDEQRSDLPSLNPIDILEPPYSPKIFLPRLHYLHPLILVGDDQELPSTQPSTGSGSLQNLLLNKLRNLFVEKRHSSFVEK